MARRSLITPWTRAFQSGVAAMARSNLRAGTRAAKLGLRTQLEKRKPPPGEGDWIAGIAMGAAGARRYRLYRPPGVGADETLPLMVMLHGCGQDAKEFAQSTRMNRVAARERFMVLYPEQDRLANPQGCWNWFDLRHGRALGEAQLIMKAIDQVCLLYRIDRRRIAIAGLSAGASMAALLVTRHPDRFRAVVMHSGIPPGSAESTLSALAAMHGHGVATPLPAASVLKPAAWPPLMVIHGEQDRVVSASNGLDAVQVWAEASGASAAGGRRLQRGKRYPMTVTDFKVRGALVARLVQVQQLGHAWSGGAASQPHGDALGPDASRMAWAFAASQFAAADSLTGS